MSQPSATCVNDPVASANAILIENAYQAFARGDVPAVIAKLADDVFWHVPGRGPLLISGVDEVAIDPSVHIGARAGAGRPPVTSLAAAQALLDYDDARCPPQQAEALRRWSRGESYDDTARALDVVGEGR